MTTIITNPENAGLLEAAGIPAAQPLPLVGDCLGGLAAIDVVYDPHVAARHTETIWHPPAVDRFCEYEAADESWLRPLCEWTGDARFGQLEVIDRGPAFYILDGKPFSTFRNGGGF